MWSRRGKFDLWDENEKNRKLQEQQNVVQEPLKESPSPPQTVTPPPLPTLGPTIVTLDQPLWVGLHWERPRSILQNDKEVGFGGYNRAPVHRWEIMAPTLICNAVRVSFPICTYGAVNVEYFSIGTSSHGAGIWIFVGRLDRVCHVNAGTQLSFETSTLTVSVALP